MTDHQRGWQADGTEDGAGEVIISGLDDVGEPLPDGLADGLTASTRNLSPTQEALQRQLLQKPRQEPEDEDG